MHIYAVCRFVSLSTHYCLDTNQRKFGCCGKVQKFKALKNTLEFLVISGTLFGPLVILWVPYYENQYGFGGGICGLKPSNRSAVTRQDDITISIFNYSNIELAGLAALIATLIVAIVYFTLSVKIQHAKKAMKNIFFFLLGIFVYVMAYNVLLVTLKSVKRGLPVSILSVCIAVAGKFILMFGYILAFHFSKLCDPIKKLTVNKKHVAIQEQPRRYGSHEKTEPLLADQPTRSTYFDVPYTGGFTSITNADDA